MSELTSDFPIVGLCFVSAEILASDVTVKEIKLQGAVCFHSLHYGLSLEPRRRKAIDVLPLIIWEMPKYAVNEGFEAALRGDRLRS